MLELLEILEEIGDSREYNGEYILSSGGSDKRTLWPTDKGNWLSRDKNEQL